ncbi:hypothetical protein [Bradyrhizobium sp.]|uniref:hypothetical protein n=1 Tax=Bradyrhizobium sp. TaxID=376 RepID=UPI003C748597
MSGPLRHRRGPPAPAGFSHDDRIRAFCGPASTIRLCSVASVCRPGELAAHAHGRVSRFHGTGSDETIFFAQEAILAAHEDGPKRKPVMIARNDQQRSSVMPAFLTLIYREYCKARLAEMKEKALLL